MQFKAKHRVWSWLLTLLVLLSLFVSIMPLASAVAETDTTPFTWQDTALNATALTGHSLTLTWAGAQDDFGVMGCGVETCDVSGLQPAASYTFAVQAFDEAGNESSDGPNISAMTQTEVLPLALVSAATDHLGKTVTLEFNQDMDDPAGKESQFSVSVDATAAGISAAALGSDNKQILLYLSSPIGYAATPRTVIVSYTAGDITADDGTALESFSGQNVTNNIISLELVDYEPLAAETACEDDPAGGKILTYALKDRIDYDNVNLAIYFRNGFFRNLAGNLSHPYVKFYNKATGEEVPLPNILTEPVPFTGALPDRYMEYTDWYFRQISGRAPLGFALQSRALEPDTTYVVEVLKGFSFHTGPINNTYKFEFTTTPDSEYNPYWTEGSGLSASNANDTGLTLSWPAAEDNHGAAYDNGAAYDDEDDNYRYIPNLSYNIYQDGNLIATVDEKTTSYNVTNLSPGTGYEFKVEAVDFSNNRSTCLKTAITTPDSAAPDTSCPVWTEGSLAASSVTKTGLTLTWSSASDDTAVTGYRVYQGDTLLTAIPVTDVTYNVTSLAAGTQYTFTVQAGDADGNWSTDGPSISVATTGGGGGDKVAPAWPANAAVKVSRSKTEAVLTWPAATDDTGVAGYRIKRDGTVISSVDDSITTYTDMGLERGNNTYVWSVEAFDAAGNYSEAITGQILPGQNPLSFIAENSSLTTVNSDNSTNDGPIEGSTTVPVNPTFRLYFDRGVTTDAVWSYNMQCVVMQTGTGADVPITAVRLGATDTINDNLHYIFITPNSALKYGETYKIIISKDLTANNGHTLGESNGNKDEVVTFTVAGSTGSPGGGGGTSVATSGPTSTTGSASVDPAVGATVSLGDKARVVIPANALKETGSVTVDIREVASPPAIPTGFKVAGVVYEFSVGDKTTYSFAEKVALTFEFDASQIGPDEVPAVYYYDESQAKWVNIGGTVSGSTITVEVDHFTKYTVFVVQKPAAFNDIEGYWAQNNIEKLVALGAVSGYPDGSFKPDNTITRAEFATILVKAFKLTSEDGKVFADTAGHWAEDYIATAASNGIINGYNEETFGPDDLITREQMAVMIVKAAKLDVTDEETSFKENASISVWAKGAIAAAVKNGLMKGYSGNTVSPLGSATRAEAVTVVTNAL